MGSDSGVQIMLPVHALGDGLDDQVALAKHGKVFLVVGCVDILQLVLAGERGWLEFLQAIQGLLCNAALVPFLGRKIKQHDGNIGIGQVSRDLRPHDSRAQDRGLTHNELAHWFS